MRLFSDDDFNQDLTKIGVPREKSPEWAVLESSPTWDAKFASAALVETNGPCGIFEEPLEQIEPWAGVHVDDVEESG
jgi:hypothetical protein